MPDNIFIDSNVLLYLYSKTEVRKREISEELSVRANIFISTQVIQEISNVLSKKFSVGYDKIMAVVEELSNSFVIALIETETILEACRLAEKYRYSFFDSLILASALNSNCTFLYSEDMQDGQRINDSLTIINPFK